MPKVINWPKQFFEEVMCEANKSRKIALRLGSLYYDNGYYRDDEIIDIRVNHKIVRPAQINGKIELKKIKELSKEEISLYRKDLNTAEKIAEFLANNYKKPVTTETEVTIIPYKNLLLHQTEVLDDSHIC